MSYVHSPSSLTPRPTFTNGDQTWLAESDIHECVSLLHDSFYVGARQQASYATRHMPIPEFQLLALLRAGAPSASAHVHVSLNNVIYDSLAVAGASPAVVVGNGVHFTVFFLQASQKCMYFVDPLGASFSCDVVEAFKLYHTLRGQHGLWQYEVLDCPLQTDGHNCDIRAIWFSEKWLQFMTANVGELTFDEWILPHAQNAPTGAQLRLHYYKLMSDPEASSVR